MEHNEAWERFMKTGSAKDYMAYKSNITGDSRDVSNAVLNINSGFGAPNENTNKWFDNSGIGLWRKR